MTSNSSNVMKVGGLLLAAGQSSRVEGGFHKLLSEFDGVPLVRRSAVTLLDSMLSPVVVVTGHRSSEIEFALNDIAVVTVLNPDFTKSLGTSIACGFGHHDFTDCDGVLVMLADMPAINAHQVNQIVAAFKASGGASVVRGSEGRTPGHPVIIPRALFAAMRSLEGEDGGKTVIQNSGLCIELIEIGSAAASDVDTSKAVIAAGGVLRS